MNPLTPKVRAIVHREYLQRVRSKWFLLSTLGLPLLFIGLGVLSGVLLSESRSEFELQSVGVVDRSGRLGDLVVDELLGDSLLASAVQGVETLGDDRLREEFLGSDFDLYLVVPAGLVDPAAPSAVDAERASGSGREDDPPEIELLARDNVGSATQRTIRQGLNRALVRWRLRDAGVEGLDPATLLRSARLDVVNITDAGSARSQEVFAGISMFLAFLFYIALIVYGQMMIRSIVEEKTSDVVEIMVSSVRPWELMLGKIIGVGAVGITQLAIWGAVITGGIVFGLTAGAAALAEAGIDLSAAAIPWGVVVLVVVFFIFGYLLYAGMFAGGGATIGAEQDAQQVALPIIMLIIVPFIAAQALIESPNAAWAVVMSLVPFFSPILMPSRLLVSTVPVWQVTASLLLLLLFILGVAWVAGRIYRIGILMKGQRANVPEIIRWIRHG
jgi:ABC-2 type transport system permease protein